MRSCGPGRTSSATIRDVTPTSDPSNIKLHSQCGVVPTNLGRQATMSPTFTSMPSTLPGFLSEIHTEAPAMSARLGAGFQATSSRPMATYLASFM